MAGNLVDERFRGLDFAHSPEMLRMFNNIFGLHEFRGNQLEAINATILGEDVFVVGGNGAGKSLCYQLPACLSAGVTVVISPTISLIQDQIQKLTELGIEARTLSGDEVYHDHDRTYQQLAKGVPIIKLLYVTPEIIEESMRMSGPLIEALQSLSKRGLLARFVIDEAQCIIQYDSEYFRPAFRKLNKLQKDFPGVHMIALSGPVRVCVKKDIPFQLQMTNPQEFMMSFNRTNLKYAVKTRTQDWEMDCITWIKEHWPKDSGIIYCRKRDHCDSMASSLNDAGLLACSYHSKRPDREREQKKWSENECKVICATAESFGFGIDKPDVRYVIHTFLPKSMENYYRESGRAGREGKMSDSILYYTESDKGYLSKVIRNDEFPDNEPENRELVNLGPMAGYCKSKEDCRRKQLLTYLGWGDIEANVCLPNSEAICDNCERANAAAPATG